MTLYRGIDLLSTNSVLTVLNDQEEIVCEKRLPNDLSMICSTLASYRKELAGCVVESTYSWRQKGLARVIPGQCAEVRYRDEHGHDAAQTDASRNNRAWP